MLIYILIWILLVSVFSLFGSWYARKYRRMDALVGLYVSFVLISNIVAYKIVNYNFGFFSFTASAATIIFSVTFLLTDIVNEKFGLKETRKMIFIAFISQFATAFFILLAIKLPATSFFSDNESFVRILGFAPRVMLASWIAFLLSENLDASVFAWFKRKTKGKHLWARNVFSSIPAMALDTIVFVFIAFYGIVPNLGNLIFGVLVIKWIVGVIDIPFMYLNRAVLYKKIKYK